MILVTISRSTRLVNICKPEVVNARKDILRINNGDAFFSIKSPPLPPSLVFWKIMGNLQDGQVSCWKWLRFKVNLEMDHNSHSFGPSHGPLPRCIPIILGTILLEIICLKVHGPRACSEIKRRESMRENEMSAGNSTNRQENSRVSTQTIISCLNIYDIQGKIIITLI